MSSVGPEIEHLTRRLAGCPEAFLNKPSPPGPSGVVTSAIVFDTVVGLGGTPPATATLAEFDTTAKSNAWRTLVQVTCWLLYDPEFRARGDLGGNALKLLRSGLQDLAKIVAPELFVTDSDRREELGRIVLDALGLLPKGETADQAADRLKTVSSVERERVVRETRAKEERARELREAMRKKRAQEAAARYSRE